MPASTTERREVELADWLANPAPRPVPPWLRTAVNSDFGSWRTIGMSFLLFAFGAAACLAYWYAGEAGLPGIVLLILPGLGLISIVQNAYHRWRNGRILVHGRIAAAKVLSIDRRTAGQAGHQPPLTWAIITLQSGEPGHERTHLIRTGSGSVIRLAEARRATNQTIAVIFHPHRPQYAVLPEAYL